VNSPTQRTLARLKRDGWTAQVVERWNAYAKVRVDLFGVIDIVCCREGSAILGIQCTSGSNAGARLNKALMEPRLQTWLASGGRFEIWSWRKIVGKGKRKTWAVRTCEINVNGAQDWLELV
jgi:hypothetical protein